MGAKVNKELQAAVLVEAVFTADALACAKYGVSERSLQRWRRSLAEGTDPELAGFVATKKAAFDARWADECAPALAAGISFLAEAARSAGDAQRRNPAFIAAVAGAVKIIAETKLTGEIIGSRLRQMEADGVPGEVFGHRPASGYEQ
jgi:hypothetical protein